MQKKVNMWFLSHLTPSVTTNWTEMGTMGIFAGLQCCTKDYGHLTLVIFILSLHDLSTKWRDFSNRLDLEWLAKITNN